MKITVTLLGTPRTKKNSPRVLPMITWAGVAKLITALLAAPDHKSAIRVIMSHINFSVQPSDGFTQWFDIVYLQRGRVRDQLAAAGLKHLPIMGPVSIEAAIYRDRLAGDFNGFTQAIGDAIQADQWTCHHCRRKTIVLGKCPFEDCNGPVFGMTHTRKGLGLIADDGQIVHWDGTRLYKDAARPRVELTIRTIKEPIEPAPATQPSLFTAPEPAEEEVSVL